MDIQRIDLYQHFGLPRPAGAEGYLDLWACDVPEQLGVRRRRPAVLILPGGAYRWTSLRESEPVALRFAVRGYTPFVLHYSCAPFHFPTSLRETALAMRFIRENGEDSETDPRQIAALGFSAGWHLCGKLGTLWDSPEVRDLAPAETLRPDALALCYPVVSARGKTHEESMDNISGGDGALRDRLSLEKLVRADMPPVFLWHTRNDESVPCRGTLLLAAALEEVGVDFALHVYRNGKHGLATAGAAVYPAYDLPPVSWDVPGWIEAADRFFQECGFHIQDTEGSA